MILVTGSGGTIGRELVKELVARGAPVRAAYRSRPPTTPGVEGARIDMVSGEGLTAALAGVDALFLLVGEVDDQAAAEIRVVDVARRAGVRRIVKLSVLGAEGEGYSFAKIHRAVERALESSGIPHTLLRPGSFMQNFVNFYGEMIKNEGVLALPCGDAREAHVDARDIARVAAVVLTSDGHEGKAYDLLGPQAISYAEATAKISAATGRTITYTDAPESDFRQAMLATGAPEAYVDSLLDLYRFIRSGQFPRSGTAIKDVTGREAVSFDQFTRDYADAWRA